MVEPRLTGGFAYSPCLALAPGGEHVPLSACTAPPPSSIAAWFVLARRLGSLGDRGGEAPGAPAAAAEALHAQALGQLVADGSAPAVERAMAKLERALALQRRGTTQASAALASDLGAAYLVRAQRQDSPGDLIRSVEASDEALAVDPRLPEARFNRALALDLFGLRLQAAAAWDEELRRDPGSGWSAEAGRHLRELRRPTPRDRWSSRRAALDRAALSGDAGTVRQLVSASPQAARDAAVDDLLGRWGGDWLGSREQAAARSLQIARAIGRALEELGRDGTAAAAVRAIDRASGRRGSGLPRDGRSPADLLSDLAGGHRAYGEGIERYGKLAVEEAAPRLIEARRRLARGGSPVALWAAVTLAGIEGYQGRIGRAREHFQEVVERAPPALLPALCGRAQWGLGWLQGRQGRLDAALAAYQAAAGCYRAAGEVENLGAVEGLIAEDLKLLGQDRLAWRQRYLALAKLEADPTSLHLHTVLLEATRAATDEGEPRAALALASEDHDVALRSGDPLNVAESLLWRSRVRLRQGQLDSALDDLREARKQAAFNPPDLMRLRTEIDLEAAEAELARRSNPAAAIAPLSRAITFYSAHRLAWPLLPAYASRARAELAAGREEAAEADLGAAIALFERQGRTIADRAQRESFAEQARGLFEELIAWRVDHRPAPALAALTLAEEMRSLLSGGAPGDSARGSPPAPRFAASAIPAGVSILDYAVLGDRLLVWLVRSDGVRLYQRGLPAATLDDHIHAFISALRSGPGRELEAAAKTLYDELIPAPLDSAPGGPELTIVPDLALGEVPFAALINPRSGRYLVEEHALAVAPSAAAYLAAGREGAGVADVLRWSALLVADPAFDPRAFPWLGRLPGAGAEVETLRSIYPRSTVLAGERATGRGLLDLAPAHEILHYAGHAVANGSDPGLSYLPLAPSPGGKDRGSGALFAGDLHGLSLGKLRLVVLSACQTIEPRVAGGGGLAGLARPFLDAGAAAVVGTLWRVDDRAEEVLLAEFHRQFLRSGDAAVALRKAQLVMLANPDRSLALPAAWAGVELIGRLHQPLPTDRGADHE